SQESVKIESVAVEAVVSGHVGVRPGNLEMQKGERKHALVQREFALQVRPDTRHRLVVLVRMLAATPHAQRIDTALQFFVGKKAAGDMKAAHKLQSIGDVRWPGSQTELGLPRNSPSHDRWVG